MATAARPALPSVRWPALSVGLGRDVDLLVLANVLWGVGTGLYNYLLPLYVAQLGAAPAQIGFVLALTSVVQAVVYVPAGMLADRLGRKPLMLFGWLMGPTAMLVFFLAGTWQHLVPAVVLLAAVAWCAPAYHSYIAAAAGPRDLPHAFTLMFVGATLGAALSAPVGGWLAETLGLRWVFAGACIAYLCSTFVIALLHAQSPQRPAPGGLRPRTRPRWGALLEVWGGALAAALALTAALKFATNLAQPLAPNWLTDAYGFTPADIGSFGGASALGGAALALALGRLQQRRGPQWALPVAVLSLLGYATLLLAAGSWLLAAIAYVLRGTFQVMHQLVVALVAGVLTGQAHAGGESATGGRGMGLGFALHNTATAAAVTLSTYTAGWLYGVWAPLPFLASAALLVPLLWVSWFAASRIARPPLHLSPGN